METRRIPVDDGTELQTYLWAGGAAVPVLLVHGLASNARLWDGVAARLAALGHAVAAVDLRGHGRSDKPDVGYDFGTMVADLASVLDALGWDRPVAVGQSWGASVVLELADRLPDRVRGIVCVDGALVELRDRFPEWDRCREVLAPPRIAGTPAGELERRLRLAHPGWPEESIRGQLACYEVRDDESVSPWLDHERHMRILRELWEHRPSLSYARLRVPVVLVPAEDGSECLEAKRAAVERTAPAASCCRVQWLEGHHDLHAERPADVAGLIHACTTDGFFP